MRSGGGEGGIRNHSPERIENIIKNSNLRNFRQVVCTGFMYRIPVPKCKRILGSNSPPAATGVASGHSWSSRGSTSSPVQR